MRLVPVAGVEPARVISPTDFELFASHGIKTNSTPHGGHWRTPKRLQLLAVLILMCKKTPFRLTFPHFSILTGILDFGGTSEGCNPQTEHNRTRNRFINYKQYYTYSSAIDNTFSEKEVLLWKHAHTMKNFLHPIPMLWLWAGCSLGGRRHFRWQRLCAVKRRPLREHLRRRHWEHPGRISDQFTCRPRPLRSPTADGTARTIKFAPLILPCSLGIV